MCVQRSMVNELNKLARLDYSYARFTLAKTHVFRMWCNLAIERRVPPPFDLSGSCKYGSLFMQEVFGGEVQSHYAHQYNRIGGRLIDLSHDALDVGSMISPYLHDPDYFEIPEYKEKLLACLPRVRIWVDNFFRTLDLTAITTDSSR